MNNASATCDEPISKIVAWGELGNCSDHFDVQELEKAGRYYLLTVHPLKFRNGTHVVKKYAGALLDVTQLVKSCIVETKIGKIENLKDPRQGEFRMKQSPTSKI